MKTKNWDGVHRGKKNGSWVIDYTDHNGQRHQPIFYGTRRDARQYRSDLITQVNQIKRGFIRSAGAIQSFCTLEKLWASFYEYRAKKVSAGSMKMSSLKRHKNGYQALIKFEPVYKRRRISSFVETNFEDFKAHRLKNGYSPWGVNTNLRSIKCIFNYAVKQGILDVSPLRDVALVSVNASDVYFLSEEELTKLSYALEALDMSDKYQRDGRDLTICYIYTGARSSELLLPSFTWSCVRKNSLYFPRTKQGKSRTIPIIDTVGKILEGRRQNLGGDGPFALNIFQVYKRVKRATAGIGGVGPQILRKTAGAWYYMTTRDIFATAKFLGHSTVIVTERHYAGLIQSLQIDEARKFGLEMDSRLKLGCN